MSGAEQRQKQRKSKDGDRKIGNTETDRYTEKKYRQRQSKNRDISRTNNEAET